MRKEVKGGGGGKERKKIGVAGIHPSLICSDGISSSIPYKSIVVAREDYPFFN